ncbi:MAG: GTPase [Ktedonobacteraceae bacterium]
MQEADDAVKKMIAEELTAQRNRPFVVSVMGQTGVGKTSLLNALFNMKLKVDAVRPTTKAIQRVQVKNAKGYTITFCDMPGIGESQQADRVYLAEYRKQLLESDVVIWAIHADNRSTAFDVQTIERLLEGMEPAQRSSLMSKMTFVLTKADMLMQSPWVAGCIDDHAIFSAEKETKHILEQKAAYYQELYIEPFGAEIVARTYHDGAFTLDDPSFTCTEYSVYHRGFLTQEKVGTLKGQHPEYDQIFDHLYDSYRVIPCSALFKYNLPELMLAITSKLGRDVFESFKQVVNVGSQSVDIALLDRVPFEQMLKMSNLCILDVQSGDLVFDLGKSIFPGEKFRSWFHNHKPKHRGRLRDRLLGGLFT